jgi:hypothetical protein
LWLSDNIQANGGAAEHQAHSNIVSQLAPALLHVSSVKGGNLIFNIESPPFVLLQHKLVHIRTAGRARGEKKSPRIEHQEIYEGERRANGIKGYERGFYGLVGLFWIETSISARERVWLKF